MILEVKKMKRKIVMMLLVMCMCMSMGCGSKDSTKETDGQAQEGVTNETEEDVQSLEAEVTEEPEQTEETAETTEDIDTVASLNVENDTFTFDELVMKIGAGEADMLAFLGVEQAAESYATMLFGESASIVVTSTDGIITNITMNFAATNADSVTNAVSEQLGQDAAVTDGVTQWNFEENIITLSQSGDGCVIEIHK